MIPIFMKNATNHITIPYELFNLVESRYGKNITSTVKL